MPGNDYSKKSEDLNKEDRFALAKNIGWINNLIITKNATI